MFFVGDTEEDKARKIREYLIRQPMIAILLAAANWEWTVGRCILFFSLKPNIQIREHLSKCHGLIMYKRLWMEEICKRNSSFPPLDKAVNQWNVFCEAFLFRHILIHGRGTCSRNMATQPINVMLQATKDVYFFASQRGVDLNKRLPVRRIPKL